MAKTTITQRRQQNIAWANKLGLQVVVRATRKDFATYSVGPIRKGKKAHIMNVLHGIKEFEAYLYGVADGSNLENHDAAEKETRT